MFGTEHVGMGWHMGSGGLWMLAVWAITIILVILLVRRIGRRPDQRAEHNARQILDERYARGEIEKAEYEEKRRSLD